MYYFNNVNSFFKEELRQNIITAVGLISDRIQIYSEREDPVFSDMTRVSFLLKPSTDTSSQSTGAIYSNLKQQVIERNELLLSGNASKYVDFNFTPKRLQYHTSDVSLPQSNNSEVSFGTVLGIVVVIGIVIFVIVTTWRYQLCFKVKSKIGLETDSIPNSMKKDLIIKEKNIKKDIPVEMDDVSVL